LQHLTSGVLQLFAQQIFEPLQQLVPQHLPQQLFVEQNSTPGRHGLTLHTPPLHICPTGQHTPLQHFRPLEQHVEPQTVCAGVGVDKPQQSQPSFCALSHALSPMGVKATAA